MSTWRNDITDPKVRRAYDIVGNQSIVALKNMIRALDGPLAWLNGPEDVKRLEAARVILRYRQKGGGK